MTDNKLYKSMPKSQILSDLSIGDYRFVYESLKDKKTFSYIDENNSINLLANCENKDIMAILRAKKSIYIDKHSLGALIQVKFIQHGFSFDFVYDVYKQEDLNLINNMIISEKELIISFLVKEGASFAKAFHINFILEDKHKERLNYIKEATYNLQYPRVDVEEKYNIISRFLEYEFDLGLIADVIETCDKLSKWKSVDDFEVYISNESNISIYVIGECKNFNFIKTELSNKYKLLIEGEKKVEGVPLIKYDKGYLYFYNNEK